MYKDHFELLDKYRHYPKFQLERHIDTFIGVWLPVILEKKFARKFTNPIPEFPIPKQLLIDNYVHKDARSMDFILFSEDKKEAILVELKTDIRSINKKQEMDYERLNGCKLEDIISKIYDTVKASKNSKYRYLLLLKELNNFGLIKVDPHFFEEYKEQKKVKANKYLMVDTIIARAKCRIVYVLPQKGKDDNENTICFDEIVRNDDVESDLREYLMKWISPVSETIKGYL